ncbi:hypothetical protein XAC908_650033 [Xanthomonas citri pv. citri]|nr:hypothetical protein XAC908_650033 [Xanthomonas citri pv. citri]
MANQNDNKGGTSNRGFASMDEDKQREIASKGGKAAHESGNAHEFLGIPTFLKHQRHLLTHCFGQCT